MNKVEILRVINEVLKDENLYQLAQLKEQLEEEVRKDNYISTPTDKKKIAAIKKVLGSKKLECRPILQCFTKYNNGVAFTDSYQLYVLNDEYIPFKIADDTEENREIAKKYNLEKVAGSYPKLDNVIPKEFDSTYEIDTNEFILWSKTAVKDGGKKLYKFKVEDTDYCFDADYLLNAINILKIQDPKITLELRGNIKPITIHNKDNELGLILPIRTY